ncbi:stage VI sporulation protein D [Aeribacillus sp. FSL W8-0870]|jgi:stage VI sporulation protein D|uniref:stage VI sporulation protein D n=1 Tax=Aeribacillus sp. FSL W8-0870 TaxID=2954706 RepID=UPI0030D09E2D
MSIEETSVLRFSVEESVLFRHHFQPSELLSISLEPDISIEEHDGYVTIKGALELSGEYKFDGEEQQNDKLLQTSSIARYIQNVEARNDGVMEFRHELPVDITIPKKRIANLEEVFVAIESFDYDFPEANGLKLIADLSIYGIREEQAEETAANEVDEIIDAEAEISSVRQSDERKEDETESTIKENRFNDEPINKAENIEKDNEQKSLNEYFEFDTAERDQNEQIEHDRDAVQKDDNEETADIVFMMPLKREEETETDYDTFTVEAKKNQVSLEEKGRIEEEKPVINKISNYVEKDDEEKESVRKNDNTLYLTKLFTKNEEEEFSKLRMYIVQQGDSLENICERYNITLQQLNRVNQFHHDKEISEGDILYIPVLETQQT